MKIPDEKKEALLEGIEEFKVLPMHKRKIREIAKTSKKFSDPSDFIKSAIEILMSWESKYPEDCMVLIDALRPFTPEQEAYMKVTMKAAEIEKNFGVLDIDKNKQEDVEQQTLAQTDYDHMKLQGNYPNTIKYIKSLKISKHENIIPYDGFPLLSSNYRRLLPIKLSISMLAYLLESKKATKVELKELRVHAYDLIEEYGTMIRKYEKNNDIPRNMKLSTGLPNKSKNSDDEKEMEAKIRVKDLQVGKIRNSRVLGGKHFEGALSALGLAFMFEEEGKEYVSLTELGKRFVQIENPVFPKNDFSKGAMSEKEAEFIMNEILPQRELEKQIIDKAIFTIKGFQKLKVGEKDSKKKLEELEAEIHNTVKQYIKKNTTDAEKYNLTPLTTNNEKSKRKITQRRLATMGRLTEMGIVNWNINEDSVSEYTIVK